jgi:hypothetical protein
MHWLDLVRCGQEIEYKLDNGFMISDIIYIKEFFLFKVTSFGRIVKKLLSVLQLSWRLPQVRAESQISSTKHAQLKISQQHTLQM